MSVSSHWSDSWRGEAEARGGNQLPTLLRPPQIPHYFTYDQTRAAAVGSR